MPTHSCEYIWIDANFSLRSKTRSIVNPNKTLKLSDITFWNYDGSSTGQAEVNNSEIILSPCYICADPFRNGYLVLCATYLSSEDPADYKPALNNNFLKCREITEKLSENHKPWFGFEQEYFILERLDDNVDWVDSNLTFLGHCKKLKNRPQGPYYCGVGHENIKGRQIAEDHYQACLKSKLKISGYNKEVAPGQWEYQIGAVEGTLEAAHQLWISRYILQRVAEMQGKMISFHPKPIKGDWNGSGLHTNYSTQETRAENGLDLINTMIKELHDNHHEFMENYGRFNDLRLTGKNETSALNTFTSGVGDRSASIRIPTETKYNNCGYFEDRRPSSNADPYLIVRLLVETTCK